MSNGIILYHGSKEIVKTPEIRITKYNKDKQRGILEFGEIQEANTSD